MSPSRKRLDYAKALAAIGHFATKEGLDDVCVLEFENGMILTGSQIYETGEILNRKTMTHVFSVEELQVMIRGGSDASSKTR